MFKDVFISYSSKDEYIVKNVLSKFDDLDILYWFAPKDIEVGEKHDKVIMPAIASAKIFIIFLSKNTWPIKGHEHSVSKWVRAELLTAIDYDDLYIMPIKIDDFVNQPTTNLAYKMLPNYFDLNADSLDFALNKLCLKVKDLLQDGNYKKEEQSFREIYREEEQKILKDIAKNLKNGFMEKAEELIFDNKSIREKYKFDIQLYESILRLSKRPVKDMEIEELRCVINLLKDMRNSTYKNISYYLEAIIAESYFKFNAIKNDLTDDYTTLKNKSKQTNKIKTKYFILLKSIVTVEPNFEINWLKHL